MRCKITKTFMGSLDGAHTFRYTAGAVCDLSESLAEVALAEGWAEPTDEALPQTEWCEQPQATESVETAPSEPASAKVEDLMSSFKLNELRAYLAELVQEEPDRRMSKRALAEAIAKVEAEKQAD